MTQTLTNWRERHAAKLGSAQEAVALIKDGDSVWAGGWTSVPPMLCAALALRAPELRDVTIVTFLAPYKWDVPEVLAHFKVVTAYASPYDRPAVQQGRIEYIPVAQFRAGRMPPGLDRGFDVSMIPISPPDDEGWCSFGGGVFFGPAVADSSRLLIGEVHEDFIRTGGQNRIHISRFERLAEYTLPPTPAPIPPRSEETEVAANVICTLVAEEIVYDTCTLQFGIGDVSAALPAFLDSRRDLGVNTELLPGGVVDLIEKGIVTGKHKALHPGKVTASAVGQVSKEELARIGACPDIELYDFNYTDDLRNLLQLENFVAVNNAMAVDLTGNVASETFGPNLYSGTGGQAAFAVAASTAAGGSVIVLPSSQLVGDARHPRIIAGHPPGTVVTVHRGFVDFVVTEQGIARLRGKSIRERIAELISVAHPDHRADLRKEAARLHGLTV